MTVTDRPATRAWRDALQQLDRLLQLPLGERAPILDDLKQSQPQLHSMIVSMLEAEARADLAGFLETRPSPATASLHPGAQLGPYRIQSQIGVGGMGEVWLASRDDGLYQGHVAIKTLLPHFSGGALRERFLREAQILGSLAHPNIARLLDAGSAPDGSLYLVLEYVRGICIDTWCDEQKLSVEARLRLFLDVCAAVGQAHANLVVHRDIKPPNILVTAEGQVKLLDFGVAKLLEADAGLERSDLTRMTGRVFTPEYAAPEQILGEPITTASDVYSLGVLLHVLLTGARPYGRTNNPVEIEHAVLHTEPARASQSAALNTEATAVARGTTPARLARALAGDLDNILARAMHKSPTERYPSVLAFADDLRRHLEHKPILARPESVAARTRKFMRRHRLGAAASLLVVLAICVGIAGVIWQAQVGAHRSAQGHGHQGLSRWHFRAQQHPASGGREGAADHGGGVAEPGITGDSYRAHRRARSANRTTRCDGQAVFQHGDAEGRIAAAGGSPREPAKDVWAPRIPTSPVRWPSWRSARCRALSTQTQNATSSRPRRSFAPMARSRRLNTRRPT